MADSTTGLDQIDVDTAEIEVTVNELFDAASAALAFGRHGSACVGLHWEIYEGVAPVSNTPTKIGSIGFDLTDDATNYLRRDAGGTFTVTTSAPGSWPGPLASSATALYEIVCADGAVTSWLDWRLASGQQGAQGAQGAIGTQGTAGATGAQGAAGTQGAQGAVGGGGFTSPLTTKGDIHVYGTVDDRLPVGTNTHVLTADSAQTLGVKWAAATVSGSTPYLGGLTVPLTSAFTSIGTGTTFTDKTDRLQLSVTASATTQLRGGTVNSIATPYTLDMAGGVLGQPAATDALWFGIGVSDGTKYRMWYAGLQSTASNVFAPRAAVDSWTNGTTFAATVATVTASMGHGFFFIRLTDDGTNRKFFISQNGKDYVQYYSEATNTYLTPTKFVLGTYGTNTSIALKAFISHWLITGSVLGDAS